MMTMMVMMMMMMMINKKQRYSDISKLSDQQRRKEMKRKFEIAAGIGSSTVTTT